MMKRFELFKGKRYSKGGRAERRRRREGRHNFYETETNRILKQRSSGGVQGVKRIRRDIAERKCSTGVAR